MLREHPAERYVLFRSLCRSAYKGHEEKSVLGPAHDGALPRR